MKHGYLWRGIAATTALGIILLPGSFVVRADGNGERKNVRGGSGGGGGTPAAGDGNPDKEFPRDNNHNLQAKQDSVAAEVVRSVRGGGQTLPRKAGTESESETEAETEAETGSKIEEGRYLKKNKKNQFFVPPGQEDENKGKGKKPASNGLFVHTGKKTDKFKPKTASEEAIEGRWIVVLADDAEDWDVDYLMDTKAKNHHGNVQKKLHKAMKGGIIAGMSAADAKRLSEDPNVLLVEQDSVVHATNFEPWGLDRVDQEALPLDETYNSAYPDGGVGAVVYVIDTGIRPTHKQFGDRAFTSGVYDFISSSEGGIDGNGHGTHCAGTVAGKDYGVAPGASIVGVRVLDDNGSGSYSGVIAGMDKVAEDCPNGTAKAGTPFPGKRCVASMSLGGGVSTAVNDAVARMKDEDVPVAVAAGNDNGNACNYSPASATGAITVGSTTRFDERSSFSNYGTCVDIFAPGSSVLSAWHTGDTATNTISGTSMATPHVAGAAALILGANPTLTADELEAFMLSKAVEGVLTDVKSGSPNKLLNVAGCVSPCATNEICSSGTCVCATGWEGQTCDVCNSNAACDDEIFCNGAETCSNGSCQAGPSPCSSNQICSELGDDSFCLNECHKITVELTTDNWPSETSWDIVGQSMGMVASGSGYSTGTFNEETPCLPEDEYTFTIYDSYGDGMCCSYGSGSYTVTNHTGGVLREGGSFGRSEATDFAVTLPQGPCDANPCKNGGTCTNDESGSGYTCSCPVGTSGTHCEIDVDECDENTDDCVAGAMCSNSVGSYSCVCPAGFIGDGKTSGTGCTKVFCGVDERVESHACVPCGPGTTNADGDDASGSNTGCDPTFCGVDEKVESHVCVPCGPGTTNPDGGDDASKPDDTTCDDINECAESPCQNEATCTNTYGDYQCTCTPGWQGKDCNIEYTFKFTEKTAGFMVTCDSKPSADPDPNADSCWGKVSAGDSDECARDVPLDMTLHNYIWANWMVGPSDRNFRKAEYEIRVNGEKNKAGLTYVPDTDKGNSYQLHMPLDQLKGWSQSMPTTDDTVFVKLKIETESGDKLQTQHMPINMVDPPPVETSSPTKSPSQSPTTGAPTTTPSFVPSEIPSMLPTQSPSLSPTTGAPTTTPSFVPSEIPSMLPTQSPSLSPTSGTPTTTPSSLPSEIPSISPTQSPSQPPTTGTPTTTPSSFPSEMPSMLPTQPPSQSPTTGAPTTFPSSLPSKTPSMLPTQSPSQAPITGDPTEVPSKIPSQSPSVSPTSLPSENPTTSTPTEVPSQLPSKAPSASPTSPPSQNPTTAAPVSSCTLPNKDEWLTIGTDGTGNLPCSEIRTVNLDDTVTMVYKPGPYTMPEHVITDVNQIKKIEVEFKVMGDKDRKTKWRIESNFLQTIDSNRHGRPHAFHDGDVLRFGLDIPVKLIGDIGGTENGDGKPLTGPGHIVWKWKVETKSGRKYELRSSDNGSMGDIHVVA